MIIKRDEKVINALVFLLETNIGYGISLFGLLDLYQLEDQRFAVNRHAQDVESSGGNKWIYEEIFEDVREAVEFFEQKRREYELGFDIEAALSKEAK